MIKIALLGFGVVGQGTANLLTENAERIAARLGDTVEIAHILDLRDFPDSPFHSLIIHDYQIILKDPEVTVVAEMMGGSHPAYEFSMQALEAGKSVVTSNKEVVANYGDKLIAKAQEMGVSYLFEASVGGGIPILRPLVSDLSQNGILEISGILNGTTNYILTRMAKDGAAFADALKEAQEKGYAEAKPDADILGLDACRKIVILSALASGNLVPTAKVPTEGITDIRTRDVENAAVIGASVKLLGRYIHTRNGDTFMMVSPFLVPSDCPLASIDDVYNGILVEGDFVGRVLFEGRGAGAEPTASAVVGDICNILGGTPAKMPAFRVADDSAISDIQDFVTPRYIAVTKADLTAVKVIFGGNIRILAENEEEIAFLTPAMSGRELENDVGRLTACGGKLLSSIPFYTVG